MFETQRCPLQRPSNAVMAVAFVSVLLLAKPWEERWKLFPSSGASLPSAHQALQAFFLGAAQANPVFILLATAHVRDWAHPPCAIMLNLWTSLARATSCLAAVTNSHNPSSSNFTHHRPKQYQQSFPILFTCNLLQGFPTLRFPSRKPQCLRSYCFRKYH